MPLYIFFALLSMGLVGAFDFIYGRAVRRGITPGTMTCSQACVFVPVVTLWALIGGDYRWTAAALLGPLAALFLFFGTVAFMKSVRLGEASVSTPIYRISFVITALLAVLFLGETMTLRKGLGCLLAAASIFLLSRSVAAAEKQEKPGDRIRSISWALAAMISIGVLNVIYKLGVGAGVSPAMFLHSQGLCFIMVAFVYAFLTQGGPRFSPGGWLHGAASGLCISTGLIALLAALKRGDASVVTPIAQLSFVFSALLATVFLGERFTFRKTAGFLLAAATIAAFMPG